MFETGSKFLVPQIGPQCGRPLVLIQADGVDLGCEPSSECRLARGRKPTDEHEPRRSCGKFVNSVRGHGERLRAPKPPTPSAGSGASGAGGGVSAESPLSTTLTRQ